METDIQIIYDILEDSELNLDSSNNSWPELKIYHGKYFNPPVDRSVLVMRISIDKNPHHSLLSSFLRNFYDPKIFFDKMIILFLEGLNMLDIGEHFFNKIKIKNQNKYNPIIIRIKKLTGYELESFSRHSFELTSSNYIQLTFGK